MSDFDKEAERERLREKYERDRQKREATQRMSELLLQGATMTNRHCDVCGNPLFRYDGEVFCAEDHEAGGAETVDDGQSVGSDDDGTTEAADQQAVETTGADDRQAVEATEADDRQAVESQVGDAESAAGTTAEAPSSPAGTVQPGRDTAETSETARGAGEGASDTEAGAATGAGGGGGGRPASSTAVGGLGTARASLVRTLERFAKAAEATEDPRRAREHLAAAREAAEAISALDR